MGVLIVGIMAAIAVPKFAKQKQKAIVASMKSDLRNLVTAEEAFFSDNNDYAGAAVATAQVNGVGGAGKVSFVPSTGNVLVLTWVSASGWKATMTNPAVTGVPATCGIYTGPAANSPNAAVVQEGAPGCW